MTNREALIAGAKECLLDRGMANTTARDIAAASGVSLAAIGYHFGTKEALLNVAFIEMTEEWGDALAAGLGGSVDPSISSLERVELVWQRVIAQFDEHRPFWAATFGVMAQADAAPEVRAAIAAVQDAGRRGLAALFTGMPEEDPRAPVVGAYYQSLLAGLMGLMMVDPATAPTARELTEAARIVASM
jgi:AcrR family transcriptional regulator